MTDFLPTTSGKLPNILLLEVCRLADFPIDFNTNYNTHLLCHRGTLHFEFNEEEMSCRRNEFLFWFAKSQLKNLRFSKGFRATVILVEDKFLNDNLPDQKWSIDATLHSRIYPVKSLNEKKDRERILKNFHLLYDRFAEREHRFYEEALKLQMRLFILDMWHTFADEYERRKRSLHTGTLYEQFIILVQEHCMKEREVQYYANKLHITAKYLNAVCKQNSGITASEWIKRFTKERIVLLLQNENLTIAEIADDMEFSSRSFFTRYVKKLLGVTPSDYRNRLG